MPIKSRIIEEKLKQTIERNNQFRDELSNAGLELESLYKAVVKGTADTDAIVSTQTRINVIEQTISRFDLEIVALEADLVEQKRVEAKRLTFQNIKILDDEAEKLGSRFIKLYSEAESLNYARFAEMSLILFRIDDLRAKFNSQIHVLIPNANRIKTKDLPALQSELDDLLTDLQKDCKLGALRSTMLASDARYVADNDYALQFPKNDLNKWIWESIRIIRHREAQRHLPEAERIGFFTRILKLS